jgi:hypothetical protein
MHAYINFSDRNNENLLAFIKASNAPDDFPYSKPLIKLAITNLEKMRKVKKKPMLMEEQLQKSKKYDEVVNLIND